MKIGDRGCVELIEAEPALRLRLMQLGFTNGAVVSLTGKAPLGDPYEVTIRGYRVSVRAREAQCIEVAKEGCSVGCKNCARGKPKFGKNNSI